MAVNMAYNAFIFNFIAALADRTFNDKPLSLNGYLDSFKAQLVIMCLILPRLSDLKNIFTVNKVFVKSKVHFFFSIN